MQLENLTIRPAGAEDLARLSAFPDTAGPGHDGDYFPLQYDYQRQGSRVILMALVGEELAGYCILNWAPKYAFFKKLGFPEIQDLNVLRTHRRKGIARAMIAHCEDLARAQGLDYMGIGVGVCATYGPAQILYTTLGYIPDGNGVTYDRQQIAFADFRPVDDDLCLMLVKEL